MADPIALLKTAISCRDAFSPVVNLATPLSHRGASALNHQALASFIWSVADLLRGGFQAVRIRTGDPALKLAKQRQRLPAPQQSRSEDEPPLRTLERVLKKKKRPEMAFATSGPLPPWILLLGDCARLTNAGSLHIRDIPYMPLSPAGSRLRAAGRLISVTCEGAPPSVARS